MTLPQQDDTPIRHRNAEERLAYIQGFQAGVRFALDGIDGGSDVETTKTYAALVVAGQAKIAEKDFA